MYKKYCIFSQAICVFATRFLDGLRNNKRPDKSISSLLWAWNKRKSNVFGGWCSSHLQHSSSYNWRLCRHDRTLLKRSIFTHFRMSVRQFVVLDFRSPPRKWATLTCYCSIRLRSIESHHFIMCDSNTKNKSACMIKVYSSSTRYVLLISL